MMHYIALNGDDIAFTSQWQKPMKLLNYLIDDKYEIYTEMQ